MKNVMYAYLKKLNIQELKNTVLKSLEDGDFSISERGKKRKVFAKQLVTEDFKKEEFWYELALKYNLLDDDYKKDYSNGSKNQKEKLLEHFEEMCFEFEQSLCYELEQQLHLPGEFDIGLQNSDFKVTESPYGIIYEEEVKEPITK